MKPRHPKRFSSAVTKVRSGLGEAECARIVGRSGSLIRKWADPDHASTPNLEQALALDLAYINKGLGRPPLMELYEKLISDAVEEELPSSETIDVLLATLSVQGVVGDLSEAIRSAMSADGPGGVAMTPRERVSILEILERLEQQADVIEDAVEDD